MEVGERRRLTSVSTDLTRFINNSLSFQFLTGPHLKLSWMIIYMWTIVLNPETYVPWNPAQKPK